MKKCNKCGVTKPFTDFYKRKSSKDGLQYRCRDCDNKWTANWAQNNKPRMRELNASWYVKNAEHDRQMTKQWRKNNPEKWKIQNNKRRTKKIGNGTFFVSQKFISNLYNSACFICGNVKNIEMDHIIPISRGGQHSEGNLQPLCRSCNASKGRRTMTEWKYQK